MRPPSSRDRWFETLNGFEADDLAGAFECFRLSAAAIVEGCGELRPALRPDQDLQSVCRRALAVRETSHEESRRFFEEHFQPEPVGTGAGGQAFFTGYYEPVVDGALERSAAFQAPLVARPGDLVTLAAEVARPAWAETLSGALVSAGGGLEPYPDRASIEAAVPSSSYRPVAWVRDWVEAFLIHVQGSARIRLADGRLLRVTYAGRNGRPYTSIGRLLVERGEIAPHLMSLDRLKEWIRANGQEPGAAGRTLMQENASFIFFEASITDDERGPTGGAGVPLTPLRSIAVDRSIWCYGLPFWIEADLPWKGKGTTAFRRLMIAQDTGSAILGAARADLYFGSGPDAGHRAGNIRHHGRFTVLRPRRQGGVT